LNVVKSFFIIIFAKLKIIYGDITNKMFIYED